jgi:hypothetical protein
MNATPLATRSASAQRTPPPVAAELVARLPRPRALRVRTALGALLLGPPALGTSFALLAIVVAAPTLAGRLFGPIVGAACTAFWSTTCGV